MYISQEKTILVHDLIDVLYIDPINESMIQLLAQKTASILESPYFALLLFPTEKSSIPLLLSSNPPEFIPAYNSVYKEDFLTETLVNTGKECVLSRIPGWKDARHKNFLQTLGSVRPSSDGIYVPIKSPNGVLLGLWAIARASGTSPVFTDNELDTFRFLTDFMSNAYLRSLRSIPKPEDVAFLDFEGNILQAGDRIKDILKNFSVYGKRCIQGKEVSPLCRLITRYKHFEDSPWEIGMDEVEIYCQGKFYAFAFQLLGNDTTSVKKKGLPYALVSLLQESQVDTAPETPKLAVEATSPIEFTKREQEVLEGIYRGLMNKEIAYELGVDESTIKRHTHNIFEKTGFNSRVELILGMPSPSQINFS